MRVSYMDHYFYMKQQILKRSSYNKSIKNMLNYITLHIYRLTINNFFVKTINIYIYILIVKSI